MYVRVYKTYGTKGIFLSASSVFSIVERGDNHVVHAAVAFIFAYSVVAFLAPAHTPGVFYDPVRFFVQPHRGKTFFAVTVD